MTYKIPMLNMPVFSSDSINEAFKSMGDVPQMNIEVDFHTEYLYKLFIKKTIAEYVNKVSPNICQLMVNSEILKCILRDNPNIDTDRYFKEFKADELTKIMEEKILPLPK